MRFSIATAYLSPDELIPIAKAADELGYHGLALSDHVVNLETLRTPYPYTADGSRRWSSFTNWVDPWVTIGALGAVTERLRFFTNIFVLPLRDPFTVAKAVSTASALTGGRVALGVGMGWCEEEFELMNQPFARRGARADEMLKLLTELWSGEWVEHHGEFYDVPRLEMNPPVSAPVPIYVGGLSPAAYRRAARHDGWVSDMMSIDEAGEVRTTIDAERRKIGREDRDFSMIVSLSDAIVVDDFHRAEAAGVTDNLTMPWAYYGGFRIPLAEKIDGMKRFAEDIMGPLQD
ncbi:MAG: TIGR03619 family F420-dependent LLM class oxidoreductase [Aquihabitans sp.]